MFAPGQGIAIGEKLGKFNPVAKVVIVLDKDVDLMLRRLAAIGTRFVATSSANARALGATELGRALDALLPGDVAVRDLRQVPVGFHPRHAARYREYRYTVWNGPRSPLRERMALGVRTPLDTAAMARAGSVFIGRHDFGAFGATDRSPVRTVMAVRVRREGRTVTIDVRADAFLRGMVRRMVACLLEVGLGKMDEEAVRTALAGPGPALDGASAPAMPSRSWHRTSPSSPSCSDCCNVR